MKAEKSALLAAARAREGLYIAAREGPGPDPERSHVLEDVLVLSGGQGGLGQVRRVCQRLGGQVIQSEAADAEHVENLVLDVDRLHTVQRSHAAPVVAERQVLVIEKGDDVRDLVDAGVVGSSWSETRSPAESMPMASSELGLPTCW
jgi:hypothetical protein